MNTTQNLKQVNDIYFATVGKEVDTFTMDQANTLYSIADQCPMVGGNAVYKARSMYRLINDTLFFDDQQLCIQHGIIVKSVRPQNATYTGVVPNPAKDQATLELTQQLNNPAVFIIFNSIGAEVLRFELPQETGHLTFSTSTLSPALYHYQVRGPSGLIGSGKLTIIH